MSIFWKNLGHTHQQDLEQFGYENIKRRQAFRYFNWNWRWRNITKSEQGRFLLKNTDPRTWAACLTAPPVLSDAAWQGAPLGKADRFLYTFAVRLLWSYARSVDSAGVLSFEEPLLGNPVPVYWQGRLISQDLANTALETEAILRALNGKVPQGIVEIWAGYGRTAYVLMKLFPEAQYTIIDIEPTLSISKWYLMHIFPNRKITFVNAETLDASTLPRSSLAVSISSLQEMTLEQIEKYITLIDRLAPGGTVYLKQWEQWYNPDDGIRVDFQNYPIPKTWRLLFRESAPVQTRFTQAAWNVPAR